MSRHVGIVGTFDVANYGDLLFPYLAEHELRARLGDVALRRYSYHDMSADSWCYDVRSITRLEGDLPELDALVVGGGHLLRLDDRVAPDYAPPRDDLHHPTAYWLWPMTLAASRGLPVAWNALGASEDLPGWGLPLLRLAAAASDHVAVRDDRSRVEVLRAWSGAPVQVVPDTAFGLQQLLAGADEARERAVARLRAAGVGDRYVVVQPSAHLAQRAEVLDAVLGRLQEAGIDVVQLPISPGLGDRVGRIPLSVSTASLDDWPPPLELAAVISAAQAVVAHSFHLSVTALTAGVPVLRSVAPRGTKYGFIEQFDQVGTLHRPVEEIVADVLHPERRTVGADVQAQVDAVAGHWDRVAALVQNSGPGADRDWAGDVGRWLPTELAAIGEDFPGREEVAELRARAERQAEELEYLRATVTDDQRELQRREADLERRLRAAEAEVDHARGEVNRWRDEFHRLRRRRVVRAGLRLADLVEPVVQALRPGRDVQHVHVPATEDEAAALTDQLRSESPGSARVEGPLVSICVLNRDGEDHLRRLLAGLRRTTYRSFELVLVDNGSSDGSVELVRSTDVGAPVTIIENAENASFSDGNNQAVAAGSGTYVLLLNNDIEPVADGWLGRLVDTLEGRDAAAVGARLVYPRRPGLGTNQGDTVHPDLSLQHRGVHFATGADGIPVGRNLGAGEDPRSDDARAVVERPAVTAACMLLRREDYDAVGGLTSGYQYGTEDVDLCLKLRRNGGRIVYDGQAVLWHHEYGTQNQAGRERKRRNRIHNRELFVDQWGPQLHRQVLLDRLGGLGHWSDDPLHVAITVTRDDPEAGYGDYYTAHELGDALTDVGFRVTYVERYGDDWYDLDGSIDVLVVLLDAFDLRRVPRSMVSVAWVRNWTDRWIDHPWFADYDVVLASSTTSKELIEERTSKVAHLFPLATNHRRFTPEGPAARAALAVFSGNYWDKPRAIIPALQALPDQRDVRVLGANWERVDGVSRFAAGAADYVDLPAVYRGARAVIDDTAEHTAPYRAVNSRVFDALATGTPVITDNPDGLAEVLGTEDPDELLVWQDGDSLAEQLDWLRANPDEALRRAERWREIVLRDHTYARRAEQLRDLLVTRMEARSVAIAIGVPRDEERHRWGDEHFARDLQRSLEHAGHPCRVLILPEWEQHHAAREDVVLHLFGLSELRPRRAQTNALWNISHPELVTARLVDRYDVAFCAGRSFTEELAGRAQAPVHYLPQATEPSRFRPDAGDAPHHDLLFVGNSRKVRRRIIDDVVAVLDQLPGSPRLSIYGADWTPDLVSSRHVAGDHVDNDRLGAWYAAADVVLNDHWDDMRAHGFLSNRLYDALAAGAFVVSDHVDGIEEQFDGAVVTYTDREELAAALDHYLRHPEERQALAARGRAVVLAEHTFAQRAEQIMASIDAVREAGAVPSLVADA